MGFSIEDSVATHGKLKRGIDRQSCASGASLIWSIVIPPAPVISGLLRRVLRAYEGGSVSYRVWLRSPSSAAPTYSATPINVISANAQVQFRRVTSWDNTGATLNDIDEIPATGTGNNTSGGGSSVESLRIQPQGAEFILVATNDSNATRNITLALTWLEVLSIADLNDEI